MLKGQASSEYLMLLGVALMAALVVIGILTWYPISEKQTTSDLAWNGWVEERLGVSRIAPGVAVNTLVLGLKNPGKDRITVKSLWAQGYPGEYVWYGDTKTYDNYSHVQIGPNACDGGTNIAKNCNIIIDPGQTLFVQIETSGLCAPYLSMNSVKSEDTTSLRIYYDHLDIVILKSGNITVPCDDYFRCNSNSQCEARYPGLNPACYDGSCIM